MLFITRTNLYSILAEILPANGTFLEAGAFNGKDTLIMAAHFPEATIHAFEPLPEIYDELQKNTGSISSIKTYPIALSAQTGTATFYVADHPKRPGKICQAGSLHAPQDRLNYSPITYPRTTQVPTITLDEWATQNHITHIDFMWLDMQGHELAALKASPHILKTVIALYVELNFIQAYEAQPSASELHKWLLDQGFTLKGADYQQSPTHFFGNHLYVRKILFENNSRPAG
jgi:FkbM family methyltransferase